MCPLQRGSTEISCTYALCTLESDIPMYIRTYKHTYIPICIEMDVFSIFFPFFPFSLSVSVQ